jgi:hypothetical protein
MLELMYHLPRSEGSRLRGHCGNGPRTRDQVGLLERRDNACQIIVVARIEYHSVFSSL